MTISYYPGCTMKTSATNYERSALAVAKTLGIKIVELEDWNCCGVVATLASDDLMHQLAPIRNLMQVQTKGGNKVLVLCDMCYNTLKQSEDFVQKNPDKLETINAFMDTEKPYKAGVKIIHFLEYLRDEYKFENIKKKVVKKLKSLKVVPYYGCMLLRPKVCAIDDPEEPTVLKGLMESLGAEVVDNPFKIECCGSYNTVEHKEIIAKRIYRIVKMARDSGGELIVLSCPLCRFNLDERSKLAQEIYPDFVPLPVMYYTQFMALALGLDPEVLGLEKHYVDPRPLLMKKGFLSPKEMKSGFRADR
jgi:heterodisulfide reductase subunit B